MSGDWGGYRTILDSAKADDEQLKRKPIVDCPVCGTIVEKNERLGIWACPLGHFRTSNPISQS